MAKWILTRVLIGLIVGLAWKTAAAEDLQVRLTYYTDRGTTYSGRQTAPGVGACSWNLSIGTVLVLPNGQRVTCLDRGLLGNVGWLDVWVSSLAEGRALAAALGDYITVSVER